jgi:putative transposase
MALFSFSVGLVLRRGENQLEFQRLLPNGVVQLENQLTREIHQWPMSKLYRDINNGELTIVRGTPINETASTESCSEKTSLALLSNLESLPEAQRSEIERRLDYIRVLQKQGLTRGRRKQIAVVIQKIATRRNEKAPSTSTVMDWWRTYDTSGQYPGSLVSGYYHRQRQHTLHQKVIGLVFKVLKAEYFTLDRKPLSRSHLLINRALEAPIVVGGEIVSPNSISMSTINRLKNQIDPYHRDVARYGPGYARNKWRYSLKGVSASRVLERIEIDHTLLDVVVICDRSGLPLGRPTLTVVIDSYSGYVLGFFVSFWGTGLGPTLNALKIAISPKDEYCKANPEIRHAWLGFGLPELIVVDNGLEFHSKQFQAASWHLNSDIEYCAVRQPWLKPFVERSLEHVGLYLPSAGRVHKPTSNYIPPNPRNTACITLSQLSVGLLKCFVDILPFEAPTRTLREPYEVFQEGFERLPPPLLPTSFQELSLICALGKNLTVGNEGIVTEYLRYNSHELQSLRRDVSLSFRTNVKFHPEDLDFVYVQDPHSKNWLEVPSCQPEYTQQLSITQHRAIRRRLADQLARRNTIETLMRGKQELIDLWDGFLKGNRGKKSVEAAKQFGSLTSAQSLLREESPMAVRPPPSSLVIEQEFQLSNREIPNFSSVFLD